MRKKLLLLCIFTFSLFTLCASAENEAAESELELPANMPSDTGPINTISKKRNTKASSNFTEKEIIRILELQAQYSAAKENEIVSDKFTEIPKTGDGEYTQGKFKAEVLDNAVDYLNYLRNLAGMPSISWSDGKVSTAQYGAVGMAAVRTQSHYITSLYDKPEGMSDSFWQLAGMSVGNSCIHSSSVENSLIHHLDAYMYDYGDTNKEVGHRSYLLSKRYSTIGFGYAQTTPVIPGRINYYTVASSYLHENKSIVPDDFITSWPSEGVFPTNQVYTDLRWSVHLNNSGYSVDENEVEVILKNTSTGETWEFSNTDADGEFTLNNGYGYRTIVFCPENINYSAGQEYTVTVTGIAGTSTSYSYTTKLFDMEENYSITDTAYVRNESEFQEALDNTEIVKIILANNIQLSKPLEVSRSIVIAANKDMTVMSDTSARHMNVNGNDITIEFPGSMVTLDGNDLSGGINIVSGSLSLKNASIKKCYNKTEGAAIRVQQNSQLTLEESILTNNAADGSGGAIYAYGNTKVTLKGNTKISANSALNMGGGVYVNGLLTLKDTLISNNSLAKFYGGGIYVYGTLTIEDSKITSNTAAGNGGGVYVDGTYNLKNSIVSDNTSSSSGGGIYTTGEATIYGGEVSRNTASYGGGIAALGNFTTENSVISDNIATGNGGGIFTSYGILTIHGGQISGNTAPLSGGGIYCTNSSTVIMKDGKISNNSSERITNSYGGGVYIYNQGIFIMENGEISNNTATGSGGGVYIGSKAEFILKGGVISDNTTPTYGGGVYSFGPFLMEGGKISSNTANFGGGVHTAAVFTMEGGEISGNTADKGGGIYNTNNQTVTIEGGKISGNTAAVYGGGIFSPVGKISMEDGEITNNTAYAGGGIHFTGSFTMKNGQISHNTASYGGGLYAAVRDISNFIQEGGEISSNNASIEGNDIYHLR